MFIHVPLLTTKNIAVQNNREPAVHESLPTELSF